MRIQSVLGIVLLALLAGCASRGGHTTYSRYDVGKPWSRCQNTIAARCDLLDVISGAKVSELGPDRHEGSPGQRCE